MSGCAEGRQAFFWAFSNELPMFCFFRVLNRPRPDPSGPNTSNLFQPIPLTKI